MRTPRDTGIPRIKRRYMLLHGLSQRPVTLLWKTKQNGLTSRGFTWLPSFDFCIAAKIIVPRKSCFVYSRLSAYICRPAEKEERPWRCKLSHTTQSILHKFKPQPQYKHVIPPSARPGPSLLYLQHNIFGSRSSQPAPALPSPKHAVTHLASWGTAQGKVSL